ncbi:Hypothetical predicted protein, partial [Paramuricea clavata]
MLGSAIGSHDFVKTFTAEKIDVFVNEIEDLAKIAEHYPQSAYAAFSHCIVGKWRYLMWTVKDIDSLFEPLEDSINQVFIPALTGRSHCNADERSFISLPIRYGGLNIINPITNASHEYQSSQKISTPLKGMIVKQRESFSKPQLQSIKASLRQEKKERMKDMSQQCFGMSGYLTESGLSWLERKQIPVFPFTFRVILTVVQYASVFKQRKPLMKETKHGCMCFALLDKPFHFDMTVFIDVERNPGPRFEILGKKHVNSQALESRSTCFDALDLPVKIKYSRTVLFAFENSNQCVCIDRWLLSRLKCLEKGIDLLGITETWLHQEGDDSIVGDLCPTGYKSIHVPKSNGIGGGVGLLQLQNFDCESFNIKITSSGLLNIDDDTSLSVLVNNYHTVLCGIVDELAPVKTLSIIVHPNALWYNDEMTDAKKKRRRLERKWRSNRLDCNRANYLAQCDVVNKMLHKAREEYYSTIIRDNTHDQRVLFQTVEKLLQKSLDRRYPLANSDRKLADAFADYFVSKIDGVRQDVLARKNMARNSPGKIDE